MIKTKYILSLLFFLFILFSCNNNSTQKEYLTKKEVEKDCEELNKYLQDVYISYNENLFENAELANIKKQIINNLKFSDFTGITVQDFQKTIVKELQKNITIPDFHLSIFSELSYDNIFAHQNVYFTEIILYEKNGVYYVSKDYDENIKKTDIYTGSPDNLFRIFQKDGTIAFQYGIKTSQKIKSCNISINNQNYLIKVLRQKELTSDFYSYNENKENIYIQDDTIFITNLDFYNPQSYLSKMPVSAEELRNYNVVIDLKNNSGGNTKTCLNYLDFILFAQKEAENLEVFEKIESTDKQILISSQIWDANYELSKNLGINRGKLAVMNIIRGVYKVFHIKYIYSPKNQDLKRPVFSKYFYPKNIIIVMNKNTSSAAELLIADLYELAGEKVITIGENSAGCVSFMGNYRYMLPNSKIGISLSNVDDRNLKQFKNPKFMGELKGFQPDYWIVENDLYEHIRHIIKSM